jgi:chaperonin cofactor prefoldin
LPGFVKALQALSKHSLVDGLKQAEELDPARLRQLARQISRTQTELVKVQAALNKQQSN